MQKKVRSITDRGSAPVSLSEGQGGRHPSPSGEGRASVRSKYSVLCAYGKSGRTCMTAAADWPRGSGTPDAGASPLLITACTFLCQALPCEFLRGIRAAVHGQIHLEIHLVQQKGLCRVAAVVLGVRTSRSSLFSWTT